MGNMAAEKPSGAGGVARLSGLVDPAELQSIFQKLHGALDLPLALCDSDATPLLVKGEQHYASWLDESEVSAQFVPRAACPSFADAESSSRVFEQRVHGLCRVVLPVYLADDAAARLMIGPFARSEDTLDPERFANLAATDGRDVADELAAMRRVPICGPAQVTRAIALCLPLAEYLGGVAQRALRGGDGDDPAARDRLDHLYRSQSELLRAAVGALDALLACSSTDGLYEAAVSLARERLGLERCAIFVRDGELVRGTCGTAADGAQTDERSLAYPLEGYWASLFQELPDGPVWRLEASDHAELRDGQAVTFGQGWVAVTQLRGSTGVSGVMFNDAALTGGPFDPDRQNVVALYAALVAGLAERITAEQQLRDSADRLLESSKLQAVGHLAGGVAHEFNNLLAIIRGHADLAAERLPDELAGSITKIQAASDRAAVLVRQLLAFSRRRMGQPARADLNALLLAAEPSLSVVLGHGGMLRYALATQPLMVVVDPSQIEEVVLNLVLNSKAALGEDGGEVVIRTTTTRHDELSYAVWQVTDNGCGMPPEVRERVFEPFFTTREVGQGTGLGLSAVYGLVQQAGGRIECDSQVGGGTTFTIYLPLDASAPASEA